MVITHTQAGKGQLVHEVEWKRTYRRTRPIALLPPASAVGNDTAGTKSVVAATTGSKAAQDHNNGTNRPHRHRLTNRSTVFARWRRRAPHLVHGSLGTREPHNGILDLVG